jgi:hypothetical protein
MHHTKLIIVLPQKLTLCLSRASFTKFFANHAHLAVSSFLEAICAKVPELIKKEKMGDRVQGEPDLSGKIVQGDLKPHSTYL